MAKAEKDFEEVKEAAVSNAEIDAADHEVAEPVQPDAPVNAHAVLASTSPKGMPADVHQALVSASQLPSVREAETHEEVSAVLDKYAGSGMLLPEVEQKLREVVRALEPRARLHKAVKSLLEKHV